MKAFAMVFICTILAAINSYAQAPAVTCEGHDNTFIYRVSGFLELKEIKALVTSQCHSQSSDQRDCIAPDNSDCTQSDAPKVEPAIASLNSNAVTQLLVSTQAAHNPPDRPGGTCDAFRGCKFPNRCQNGFCRAPGGGGGDCDAFAGCKFPNRCVNGFCRAPGGGGGQCTPFEGCSFPARCKDGWCVK